ncbi:MAG TPA: FAD-dependent oxidoreductase, partial [Pseudonocardia sp.]|nr:FAD-dependent oxidoreductase [Pseudonocardia sp.]
MDTATTADVLGALHAAVAGRVIAPGTVDYDRARAVSYGIDRRPAAVVRARNTTDVSRVVRLAREHGLELAVRSGGHSPAGHGTIDGGIVLDLAGLKDLDIDVHRRTAWAGAGLTAGEYTAATAAHGLATGFGDTGSVGLGGVTLSGGIGYLVRGHGLTIDNLLAAEVVTADGELRRVDARTHPDLFWAIRGGGGNVGVATRFRYRLSAVDLVTGGTLMLPATPQTLVRYVAEALAAPEQLTTIATVMPVGPHGPPVMRTTVVHSGAPAAGRTSRRAVPGARPADRRHRRAPPLPGPARSGRGRPPDVGAPHDVPRRRRHRRGRRPPRRPAGQRFPDAARAAARPRRGDGARPRR